MDELDKVKQLDLLSVIQNAGVDLKRSGSVWMGLCPLHGDKETPSLVVYPSTNSWACFGAGCGSKLGTNGGDVVAWVRQKENLDFSRAIVWLVDRYNLFPARDLIRLPTELPKKVIPPKAVPLGLVKYWHSMLKPERRAYFLDRGFLDTTIDRELWGWNGKRYSIPVWDWLAQDSSCIGVRLRKAPDINDGWAAKYIGVTGFNQPTVYGKASCLGQGMALGFAGEFDAARAQQDGFAAFSMVNGVNAFHRFPPDWPSLWFPDTEYLIVVFDKKEEAVAGRLADVWSKCKGSLTGRVYHWPPKFSSKDYCEFRDTEGSASQFKSILVNQLKALP